MPNTALALLDITAQFSAKAAIRLVKLAVRRGVANPITDRESVWLGD